MEHLRTGMIVRLVNDRHVGTLTKIRTCCLEIRTEHSLVGLKPAAVFNVDTHFVTLICDDSRLARYECLAHVPLRQVQMTLSASTA